MFRQEKQRAYLAATSRDFEVRLRQLMQRNQLLENELRTKMDQFRSLDQTLMEQNHEQIQLVHRKDRVMKSYHAEQVKSEEMEKKHDEQERSIERERKYISEKQDEKRQLTVQILEKQQQLVHLATENKRRTAECTLLNEKIRICQMMNDQREKDSRPSLITRHAIHRIKSLQHENEQLVKKLRSSQRRALKITAAYQFQIVKREQIHRMNQMGSDRSMVIRDSLMRSYKETELTRYPLFVDRLRKIIEESIRWREKILPIDQLYYVSDEDSFSMYRSKQNFCRANSVNFNCREKIFLRRLR